MNGIVTGRPKNVGAQKLSNDESAALVMPYRYAENENYYAETIGKVPFKPVYSFVKRAFDFIASFIAIVILAIPMVIVWDLTGRNSIYLNSGLCILTPKKMVHDGPKETTTNVLRQSDAFCENSGWMNYRSFSVF